MIGVSSRADAQFNRVYLDSTAGRVGYHIDILLPRIRADDVPRGNSGGSFSGTCHAVLDHFQYAGNLPPGIELQYSGGMLFSGTPRQAGTWRGMLAFDIWCEGGPDRSHYRRQIEVTFTIDP